MPTDKAQEVIYHFLYSRLSESAKEAYRLLAELKYPLNDHASLTEQLKQHQAAKTTTDSQLAAAKSISVNLTPAEFPILNAQGALEKYELRILLDPGSWLTRSSVKPPGVPTQRPKQDAYADYLSLLGSPDCAREAFEAYQDSLLFNMTDPLAEPRAYIDGYNVGMRCKLYGYQYVRPRHIP